MIAFTKKRNAEPGYGSRTPLRSSIGRRAKIAAELAYHAALVALIIYSWK